MEDGPLEPLDPRVALANERTLLAWMRSALALVGAGTTVGTVADVKPVWLHATVALVPIALGFGAALLGYARWQRVDEAVRLGVPLPADRELRIVAAAVALIALVGGGAVVVGVFYR